MKNNLWNRIFHSKELKEFLAYENLHAKLDERAPYFLNKLAECKTFVDLFNLHKEIVEEGFEFDTSNSWNFHNTSIKEANPNCLVFTAYDRDTCIYYADLLVLEEDPEKYVEDDWLNWSYWLSWRWYYRTLYMKIKNHRNSYISEEVEVPIPTALKEFF